MSSQDDTNRRSRLSAAKRALLEKRLAGLSGDSAERRTIPRLAQRGRAPLSFAQQRLWFLDLLETGLSAYNIPAAVRLSGRLEVPVLEWCFNEIARRHESLRTTFAVVEGQPAQTIAPELKVSLPTLDLGGLPDDVREAEVARLATEEAQRPFDLERGPLLRAVLLRLAAAEHVLLLTMHHLVSDGWSQGVLVRELGVLYEAGVNGRGSPLAELAVQYGDYAQWQREWLRGGELERQVSYWREQLAGAPPSLELPTDRVRPAEVNYRGATIPLELSAELSKSLRALSRREEVTLSMTLLAAFQALLQRFSNQDDIVVGVPVANRNREEVEDLIGFFVNTLVLRTDLSGDPTFRELLGRVREVALGAYAHQDAPFEMLVEELRPVRDQSRNPLFQVIFDLQNAPTSALELPGLTLHPQEVEPGTTRFDLELHLSDLPEGIRGALVYSTSLFTEATVRRLAARFRTLLEAVVADAEVRLSRIELLTEAERRKLLSEWNDTRRDYPSESCIPELFETCAATAPHSVALAGAHERLTYEELNRRANQLAHYLCACGVSEETRVGVCVERSVEMIVAVLGILKAGGTYVPLDPAYPHERLWFMLDDAGVQLVLTVERLEDSLPAHPAPLVLLDADWPRIAAESARNPERRLTPEHLAYVTYTSGSTGRPKGVGVPHRGVVRLVKGADYVRFSPEEVFLQFAPLAFDASTFEIWGSLLNGSRLALMPPGLPTLRELGGALREHGVTTLWLTAGLFQQMVDEQLADLTTLRQLLAGGDVLSPSHVEKFLAAAPSCTLINGYGPTENTTFTCCHVMSAPARLAGSVPIGRPIANTQVFILDGHLQLSLPGFGGELYASGDGLARGYHARPGLTAERFIPHPFSTEPGARLYRTGDRARYLPDGDIEFMGRADEQVKVRGYRVEPGEVETLLVRAAGVRRAAVVVREESPGDKRMVAYVVGDDGRLSADGLHRILRERLPEYMLPSAFVILDELPLTPHGKVDRRALPAPEQTRAESYAAPRTPVEELLAGIWAEVLKVERVGIHEDFFELGGHSLLVTRLVSRAQAHFGVELPLKNFFESATVAEQAVQVEAALRLEKGLQAPPIVPVSRTGRLPLSFSQQRLWFLHALEPSTSAYNIPTAVRLKGQLDINALERTLSEVVRRHEILRTSYATVEGQPVQVIAPARAVKPELTDLCALPETEREARMLRLAAEEARGPFDLARGPLMRAALVRLGVEEHVLLLTVHHIVSDGWSQGVLVREVGTLYRAFSEGRESPLAELPVQYADFAHWQRRWLAGEVLERHLDYWRRQLGGRLSPLELPADRPRPEVQSFRGASLTHRLPAGLGEALSAICRSEGVTLFMLLVAAFKVLLYRYTGQAEVVVGSPIANRNRIEIEGLIGFFVNTLVLRTDLSGDPAFRELLARVRKVTLEAYAHQDMPFELLVEELQPERSLSHNPLFQVMFQLENTPKEELPMAGLTLSPVPVEGVASQFDLSVDVVESDEGLSVTAEYNTDLFEAETIRNLLERWRILLEGIAAGPEQRLNELPLMNEAERLRVTVEWNQTARAYPADKCLLEQFEAQVERSRGAVAVVCGGAAVTFEELNRRANQLAHRLRAEGVGPDVPVAVMLERSTEMVVGLLGILKAGGAYVPLDPAYPAARLDFMLDDVRAPLMLTQESLLARLPGQQRARVVCVDRDAARLAAERTENPERRTTADNVAYVIYTSGSTGEPKGVLITHGALSNHSRAVAEAYELRPTDRVLQFASLSFDVAAEELFPTLLVGATVVLPRAPVLESAELLRLIEHEGVSVLNLPAQFWQEWLKSLQLAGASWPEGVRLTVVGSEKVSPEGSAVWRKLKGPGGALLNAYGVSEATITSTLYRAEPHANERHGAASLPIGRPIANTQVYLLDRLLQPVPAGVPGELYLGGRGLARGYLRRPGLTAERFIPHPFSTEPGARLYRTGDVGRHLPGGDVEFVGRADEQVKVRGYRIELGEVEAALMRAGGVRRAAVAAREVAGGDRRLVAYVVREPLDASAAPGLSGSALEAEQLAQWRTVHDDEIFNRNEATHDPVFNISGWNSSYTGEPIPEAQMREWVDDAVERVLSQRPRRVLEIGCGTGLLLFRIAPHCTRYVGTDFSPAALNYIREQLERPGRALPQVSLSAQNADDFSGLDPASFDAVIINSVAQYFPSVDYLMHVLRGAAECVVPGGFIFVGDVRSLPLLEAFHTSVELHKAEAGLTVEQLRRRVERRVEQEEELVIAPAFFTALQSHLPRVARVEVEPRRGRHRNELTQFRYQVMLRVGEPEAEAEAASWIDWRAERWSLSELRRMLCEDGPQTLALANVANARLAAPAAVAETLAAAEGAQTADELKALLRGVEDRGLDPEELWGLGEELPYEVRLSWARHDASGRFDALFRRRAGVHDAAGVRFPSEPDGAKALSDYANRPLLGKQARQLVPQLRSFLKERLPEPLIPSSFVILDELPLLPNGKIDRRALPAPDAVRPDVAGVFVAPRTGIERLLAEVWADLLGVAQVGIHDNFFELGGHSLLTTQLISRVRELFQVELPLRQVFEHPHINGLAAAIEQAPKTVSDHAPKLVPVARQVRRLVRPAKR